MNSEHSSSSQQQYPTTSTPKDTAAASSAAAPNTYNAQPTGYHQQHVAAPDLNIRIPRVPRGGSPCLSLEQLFHTEDLPPAGPSDPSSSAAAGSDAAAAKQLFGFGSDIERRSRFDGWSSSQHGLNTSSLSPNALRPQSSWNIDASFPGTPDSYSEVGDFSSASSYAAGLDWMSHSSRAFTKSAYSSSSGLDSGLTSPASCFSLDDEWAATSQPRWFGNGPLCDTPGHTRPSSPGLELARTLSLDSSEQSSRRASLYDAVEPPPFSLDFHGPHSTSASTAPITSNATAPLPLQSHPNPQNLRASSASSSHDPAAPNSNSCSGYGLDPTAIFGQEPPHYYALPASPSPTQASLSSSDAAAAAASYEQQADGLWTGLSSVTLDEGQNTVMYGPHLPDVKEEDDAEKVSPTTPRVYNNDSFETWQDGNLDLNASTSASGPKRHGRARRATVSVMEAPIATKKPPPAKTPTDDLVPMHWESQTTIATKMAAIARRKQGSEARFICPFCSETFTRAYNLKGHIRAHKGERPFACDHPGCEKAFARHHDLKRHAELHISQNRFKCSGCKKGFRKIDALKRHYAQEDSCIDPYPHLDGANAELYLAASTPIPSGPAPAGGTGSGNSSAAATPTAAAPSFGSSSLKGHKKSRSSCSSNNTISRRPNKPIRFDDDADFTGGF